MINARNWAGIEWDWKNIFAIGDQTEDDMN